MAPAQFDVLVVGARCAGAALGAFLARAGMRVLMVDRDPMPSDQVLSTHTIHPPGVDVLDELGVGDAMRSRVPAGRRLRFRKGDATVDVVNPEGRAEFCPRRRRLDGLLQQAAVGAGAQLRDRTRVTAVQFENGRAVGVRAEHNGSAEELRARLVVGADGRHSFVASQVGAEEYMAYDAPRAMYWGYWDAPEEWYSDRYPFDMYVSHIGADIRVIFPTDDRQLLIGSLPEVEQGRQWRHDPAEALRANLSGDPVIRPLLAAAGPGDSLRGTVKERYFFRRAAGRGWVLLGDAGHHKEFVIGDGITEALIQARSLAPAVIEGGDHNLERWWRARDVEALPGYFWGRDEGAPGDPIELQTLVMRQVARDSQLKLRILRLPEHQSSPYDLFPPGVIIRSLAGALVRGRFGVLRQFAAQGRRVAEYRQAMKIRRELLRMSGPGGLHQDL